jgi:hypothetical protein
VIPEEELSDLMVTKPFLRSLGYWQAVFHSSLRELDPGMRSDMKHLLELRTRELWNSRVMYVPSDELREKGVQVDGMKYSAMVGAGGAGWLGEDGFLVQGPYDVVRFVDDMSIVPNAARAIEILRSTGHWDLLASSGVDYRPLRFCHLPLVYYGAYGMHGDLKDFTLKDGLLASEAKVLYRAGVEDIKGAMVKVVMD